MARAAHLKVYRTSAGFEDAYVAAPSQAAALKAWGARGDLFALGEASVVTDPDLTAAPLVRPGEIIRRPRGDMAAMLAVMPKVAKLKAPDETRSIGARPTPATVPDRSALDAAEKAAAAASERLARELDAIAEERAELDSQEKRTRRAGEAEAKRLEKTRADAERVYVEAGGKLANHSA